MKKSIAVLMLGSALLLPNNTSVEASQVDNDVQVQKAQYVHYCVLESKLPTLQLTKYSDSKDFEQLSKLAKSLEEHKWGSDQKIAKQIKFKNFDKKAPAKPVEKPVSNEVEKAPETTPAPEEQAAPEKAPTPEEVPTPETTPAPEATPEAESVSEEAAEVTPTKPAESTQDASLSAIEQAVLDLTNVERQKAGLKPLQADQNLMNSARQKSTDMASNGYFSHTSPTYGSPFDQMKANGVTYKSAAENIAMGQRSAEEVVQGWMESPGHRQNILTPEFTHIGIGYDQNGNYWTQQFIQK